MINLPRKILLATDLSARSDRAQDRAVALMKQFKAELIILHVLESTHEISNIGRIPFMQFHRPNAVLIEKARRMLLDYLGEASPHVSVRIEEGEPSDVIMRISREENCDLIITGVARNEVLGRFTLGRTVDHLMRKSEKLLLVVTGRARNHYKNIVVTTDFSEVSEHAIRAAAALFPDHILVILYAYTAPKSSSADDIDGYREQMRQVARRDLEKFIEGIGLTQDERSRVNLRIEMGNESRIIKDFVRLTDAELVVVGSRFRGIVSYSLFGSHAKRIISALPCDALVVRYKKNNM